MACVFWIILWILCSDTLRTSRVEANGLKALHSQCPDGYFGFTCRFRCRCKGSEICNKIHGSCASGCKDGYWGPGCQLSNSCYYNDQKRNYMGTKSMTKSLYICQRWDSQLPHQHTYKQRDFPDRFFPNNYCRTTADSSQPWCYTSDNRVRWEHCNIKNCNCPAARFGHNCAKECHCRDRSESCDSILGMCKSGCASGWRGFDCQTPSACPSNRYGWVCTKRCHCKNPDHCSRFSGPQQTCDCKTGYFNPPHCEPVTEPKILFFGNVRVNPGQPGIFNCTVAAFPTPYESEIMLIGPQGKRITLIESKILDQYLYTRFNLFKVNYILNGEHYTCAVTATAGSTSTTIRVDVHELPRINTPPSVVKGSITPSNVTIEWHKWSLLRGDTGDKPILWYSIYVKAKSDSSYRNAGIVYNLFCEGKCSFTVAELKPNTKYSIYIVTRRDGEGGDGPPGPVIHVTTDCSGPTVGPTISHISGELQFNKTFPKTRIIVQWIGPSANDMKCNHIKDYTLKLSSPEMGDTASTWKVPGGAVTSMSIPNQEPSTWYCVQLQFNTMSGFSSPFSQQKCVMTPETTPGSPSNFSLRRQTPTSLTMSWNRPEPAYGNITLYRIMFWEGVSTIAKGVEWRTTTPFVEFTLTGLRPHTDYQVQVQAVNSAGPGEPTPILTTKTEESVPGPVEELKNTTRTINSIRLRWDKPRYMNGDLLYFTVSCVPLRSLNKNTLPEREKKVKLPADVNEVTINGLLSATQYLCSINASTSKGSGIAKSVLVWTEATDPETPIEPVIVGVSDHTVTLDLRDIEDQTISFYRVIVEKIADGKHKRAAPQSITRTGDDFHRASRQGSSAYVTAQLGRDSVNGKFVVGDNKTYGGYYNAPLERDQTYNIWFGAFSKVDGTERRSFSRAERPVVVRAITAAPQTNHVPVIIGVLVVFILLIITFAILLLVWRKRHLTAEREKSDLPSFGPTILPEPDTSPPPTPIDNIEIEPLILPTTEYEIDTEPIYGNVGVNIPPIKVEDLWDYIRSSKDNDYEGLKREYRLIPAGLTASCDAAKKNENKPKNRYGNIIAYDHSRVVLDTETGESHDYINANYIDGYNKPRAYVAAQGPNKPTIPDIWRMVWQENSKTIIMLTNALETGKKKCEQYWPEEGCEEYGQISVQLLGTDFLPDYIVRTFLLSQNGQSKYVKQFHYTTWPDHGVPKFGHSLLLFRQKIRAYDNLDNGTVIVHCSAGVGRTGTYISIDTQLEKAKSEGLIDVHNFVQLMRTQRVNMVQTLEQYIFVYDCLLEALISGDTPVSTHNYPEEQYIFVYDCLLEALICGDTPVSTHNYPEAYKEMCQFDSEIGKSKLEEQFEILKLLSSTIERDDTTSALRPDNIFKNRCKNIIPANRCRPYLNTLADGCNDYINAVYINSYQKKDAYIVTQMPLPITVTDFWRLIYDHHSSCIVMLNETDAKDETCQQYWTLETCGIGHGPFLIETTAEIKSDPSVTIRDFTITNTQNPHETPRVVRQFHFHHWADGCNVPSSKMALLELLELVETWQQQSDNRPVTVHCMNGASRCGLFCAVSCSLERVKADKEVDVFQAVKQLRLSRTQLIDNMEQYKFCHEIVLDFLSSRRKSSIHS